MSHFSAIQYIQDKNEDLKKKGHCAPMFNEIQNARKTWLHKVKIFHFTYTVNMNWKVIGIV